MLTLITGAKVFDGVEVVDADSVLIDEGEIAAVGRGLAIPHGCEDVEGFGCTLLPGLIDAHSHTSMESLDLGISALRQALVLGVTTSLCMGNEPKVIRRLKALQRTDIADIRSAGVVATVAGSHPTQMFGDYPTLTGVEDVPGFLHDR